MRIIITESQFNSLENKNNLEQLLSKVKSHHDSFYEKNKDVIDRYHYLQKKMEEEKFIEDPKFTLSVINKETNPQIVAKIKYPFPYKGKESKSGYLTLHIGGKKRFPQWLNTPNIEEISKDIIRQKLRQN